MKPDKLLDAIGLIPDELIADADKRREYKKPVKLRPMRNLAAVACVCIAIGCALTVARLYGPDGTSDGIETSDTSIPDGSAGDTETEVTLERITIDESYGQEGAVGYFAYGGRIYMHYAELPDSSVIGEYLGRVTNVFEGEPPRDYYGDLCGNVDYGIYTITGFDPEFMLAADVDGTYFIYISSSDITLRNGADLYLERLGLVGGYESVSVRPHEGIYADYNKYPIDERQYATVDRFIESLYTLDFVYSDEIENIWIKADLHFAMAGGIPVQLTLYDGGYICFEGGNFGNVALYCGDDELSAGTGMTYAAFTGWLNALAFDPNEFATLLPNPSAEFLFYYQRFDSYYFFMHDENSPAELIVYYTLDTGKTLGRLDVAIPSDIEYDHIMPIYAGGGGGSGEVEIIVRMKNGSKQFYASINNFTYTDDVTAFEFGGLVDSERIDELRTSPSDPTLHISEYLTSEMPASAPNGVYMIRGSSRNLVIGTPSDVSMEILLAYFEIERGSNPAYGNEYDIKLNVLSPEEYSPGEKYFIHTGAGDIALSYDEALRVLTKSGANISKAPFFMLDEFGNSVEVKLHRIEGVNEQLVHAEAYVFTVDEKRLQPESGRIKLNVTTLPKGHMFTLTESYIPLTDTLKAMGYRVEFTNGEIRAAGEYDPEAWRFHSPAEWVEVPDITEIYTPVSAPSVSVNGRTAEYKGRVITSMKVMSSRVDMYSYNDLFVYDGKYYIKPEFLAQMLGMDTDYTSAFYTKQNETED